MSLREGDVRARPQPVERTSPDIAAHQLAKLRQLFPEAFTEGTVDLDKLRATLGEGVASGPERFSFTWAGKSEAIALLQTPSRATLIPCPGESVDFGVTASAFIEGDNLEVLKLLFKPYFGRVKLTYIDPPYNTGQDFVYPDNYADPLRTYLQLTGQADAEGNLLTSNPETSGRYHSAWLSMMYPRLFLARQLLSDDGVICVSIDDHEVHHLRMLLNEVFGEENFVANIVWQKRYVSNVTAKFLSDMHDHIIVYARSIEDTAVQRLERTEEQLADYKNPDNDPRGPWRAQDLSASKPYKAGQYTITTPAGLEVTPPPGRYWRCNREQYEAWLADKRIWFGKEGTARPMLKAFLSEVQGGLTPNTWWSHDFAGHNKEATLEVKALFGGESPFDTAKPVKLLSRILELFSVSDSLVLDFFAGSCTTAHAVLEANHRDGGNRRFIMVQLPEPTGREDFPTIADIAKERIRRVIAKLKKDAESRLDLNDRAAPEELGFKVFKLARPHIQPWTTEGNRDADAYAKKLALYNDPLVPGWTAENVLWEVALREGFGLNSRFDKKELANGNTLYEVTDLDTGQSFAVSLDDAVRADLSRHYELAADRLLVCRDMALDDTAAANLALQCRLKTI
jgi:adenine-specific DNA-methyltransferase